MSKYFDDDKIEGLTIRGRETGVRKLMATNLLKRFESSVHSFRMTLDRALGYMSDTVARSTRMRNTVPSITTPACLSKLILIVSTTDST